MSESTRDPESLTRSSARNAAAAAASVSGFASSSADLYSRSVPGRGGATGRGGSGRGGRGGVPGRVTGRGGGAPVASSAATSSSGDSRKRKYEDTRTPASQKTSNERNNDEAEVLDITPRSKEVLEAVQKILNEFDCVKYQTAILRFYKNGFTLGTNIRISGASGLGGGAKVEESSVVGDDQDQSIDDDNSKKSAIIRNKFGDGGLLMDALLRGLSFQIIPLEHFLQEPTMM